jgi:two-component system, LuxR family, response regulator FixJ
MPRSALITTDQSSYRVCVVDGDPAVRDSLATLIELNEHPVTAYASGEEVLRDLGSRPLECHCVIAAAELPDMTGIELFTALRRLHPSVRFALLLSRNDHAAMLAARRSGIDAVFQKPLVHRKLRRFLETA